MDMKLEAIVLPVSDIDRAMTFYEKLGFRLDIDYAPGNTYRIIQFTPPGSEASIIFGKGITAAPLGSLQGLVLAVDDIDVARRELLSYGVEVGEVFHDVGGGLGGGFHTDTSARAPGRDPKRRSYGSYASFADPDGNGWLLQEVTKRAPGRESQSSRTVDVASLANLLRETAEHHHNYEQSHAEHQWWDWYAAYLSSRQSGSEPEEATAAADHYMDEIFHTPTQ